MSSKKSTFYPSMSDALISSRQNPLVKLIRRLQQKKYRMREGAFFVEGIRVVLTALEQAAPVETLIYAPELLTSDVALQAIDVYRTQGGQVAMVTADVFQSISTRDKARGLGAIITAQLKSPSDFAVKDESVFVAMENVSDPGNLGTIVRTVDAVDADGVIVVGQSTDPFHSTALRASMGALFTVPVAVADSFENIWPWAREHRLQIIATSAHAQQPYWEAGYRLPALLLMGSEGEGLSEEIQAQADLSVAIPMHGVSSSLNLAVAAGLLLYELKRRKGA